MKSNREVLKIAQSHLGQNGSRFRKFAGLPAGAAWCNAFVDYVANEGGVAKLYFNGKRETYCPHSIQWCKKNLAEVPLYLALPMDIIYFDWDRNGNPNHIGLVRGKKGPSAIYTIEGNTDGGKVANKIRAGKYVQGVFRTHYVPTGCKKKKLSCNGTFGYHSIYNLQIALGMKPNGVLTKETVKMLQKKVGASQDGAWGPSTSKRIQKMVGATADGVFGKTSVIALQKWINKVNYPAAKKPAPKPTPKPVPKPAPVVTVELTGAQKLLKKGKELAWAYGTPSKKYSYKTGAPKAKCKAAMKKYGWASNKAELSDCGNFVSTVVRESGVSKTFKALHGVKTPFPKSEKGFVLVHSGKAIPSGLLKAGDIIRYKKTNGKQHAMMYYGDGKVCEASHKNRYGAVVKDTKRYNTQSKKNTIQVFRAKE